MNRRHVLAGAALAFAAFRDSSSSVRSAQWPVRPVRFVLPLGAGSGLDLTARLFAEPLAALWGQPVVIENKPGGDAIVAITDVTAGRDDHKLLMAASAMFTPHPHRLRALPYDARDLVPIAGLTQISTVIVAHHGHGLRGLADLAALARARPGELNWAAVTGLEDMLFSGFLKESGLAMARVPYRNPVDALNDLAAGRVDVMMTSVAQALPLVQAGMADVLAFANPQASPLLPGVPTAAASGFPALTLDPVIGLFGPGILAPALCARIASDLRQVAEDGQIAARLAPTGQGVRFLPPEDYAAMIARDRAQAADLARLLGITPTQ